MLSKVLEALGIKLSLGPLSILLGILFAFGGAATWLREDAISDTNAKWELKASQAAVAAHNAVAEKQLELEKLQKKLALKEKDDEDKIRVEAETLAHQASEFPLSKDCLQCRIPNERLWVRGAEGVAGKSSTIGTKATPKAQNRPGS